MEKYINFEKTLSYMKSYMKSFLAGRNWYFERYEKGIFCCSGNTICIYRLNDVRKESPDTARYVWMHCNSDIGKILEILETAEKTSRLE